MNWHVDRTKMLQFKSFLSKTGCKRQPTLLEARLVWRCGEESSVKIIIVISDEFGSILFDGSLNDSLVLLELQTFES